MTKQQEEIREQQRASWNKFSPGWKKWDEMNMAFLKPMGDAIIASIDPDTNDMILDVATGTGEPGLTIAQMIPGGAVTGFDISDGMISIANENAAAKKLSNYQGVVGDVCELPFPDNSFDAVSCRMGFMFFPDMVLAAKEMLRVLKPGGKLSTSVWGMAENNFWVTATMSTVKKHVDMPPPTPGAPGMFRCAVPGFMIDLLQTAGFHEIQEKQIEGEMEYDSPEHYWTIMNELAAPLAAVMEKAGEEKKAIIKEDIINLLTPRMDDGSLYLGYTAIVITGKK